MAYRQIVKNSRELIHVTPKHYMGHNLIDIRVFARTKGEGDLVATRKGISLQVDLVPDLILALKWALGQPCLEDADAPEAAALDRTAAEALAAQTAEVLRAHGAPVHWDMAERLVRQSYQSTFDAWHLHWVLVAREDLFEHVGAGCFRARS